MKETEKQMPEEKAGDENKVSRHREEENRFNQTEGLFQRRIPPLSKNSAGKKIPSLFLGGCILVLLLVVGGYFLFYRSEKLPLNKKVNPYLETQTSSPTPSLPEKKKISGSLLTKSEKVSQSVPSEKTEQVQGGNKGEKLQIKKAGETPQQISEGAKPEAEKPEATKPEAKKSEVAKPDKWTSFKPQGASLPIADPQGQYAILVGSFKTKENALDLRQKLQKKGYPVSNYPIDFSGKGGIWYRVIIGNYKDLKDAKEVASELKAKEKLPALLMKGYKFI